MNQELDVGYDGHGVWFQYVVCSTQAFGYKLVAHSPVVIIGSVAGSLQYLTLLRLIAPRSSPLAALCAVELVLE